eukprot:TRINITY_DN15450_c0_g1_i1.p1 TRINITY_DN15450_c0_g1~~TRINITY_DN15450_c0_g1_i1.p1  ORF type:complete len:527 (-),score=93.25 TRINITY_DN15450_c0_g1_i1:135-1592(-)
MIVIPTNINRVIVEDHPFGVPLEIWGQIFASLSFYDVQRLGTTCKAFRQITRNMENYHLLPLKKLEVAIVDSEGSCRTRYQVKRVEDLYKLLSWGNFQLEEVDIRIFSLRTKIYKELDLSKLNEFGPMVQKLTFFSLYNVKLGAISQLVHLKSLKIQVYSIEGDGLIEALAKGTYEELDVNVRGRPDASFIGIAIGANKNLKKLKVRSHSYLHNIRECSLLEEIAIESDNRPMGIDWEPIDELAPKAWILSLQDGDLPNFKSLSIQSPRGTMLYEDLRKLSTLKTLEVLRLNCTFEMGSTWFAPDWNFKWDKLTCLDLRLWTHNNGIDMKRFLSAHRNLKQLSLNGFDLHSDRLSLFKNLKDTVSHLEELKLNEVRNLLGTDFSWEETWKSFPKLKKLDYTGDLCNLTETLAKENGVLEELTFNPQNFEELSNALKHLHTLKKLNVKPNDFGDDDGEINAVRGHEKEWTELMSIHNPNLQANFIA